MERWRFSITDHARAIRNGTLSPVELTRYFLDRIEQHDHKLSAFLHVSGSALTAARKAEKEIKAGRWRGPLHGVPIAIKDLYLTSDMPTTAGTLAPGFNFPLRDSTVVAKLRAAGAILIGKTRAHEFAWGNVTPPTRNPWDLERVPSGSSGGTAAAVAGGLIPAGTGTDTGGSIRMPASICGTVGLKPTFGRVSRDGIVPHSWSLDHAGPLTRTVADTALMMNVMAGYDAVDPACQDRPVPDYSVGLRKSIKGLRVGVCRNHFFESNQPEVESAVEKAISDFSAMGASIHEFSIPRLRYGLAAIYVIELASSTAYHDSSLRAGRVASYTNDVRSLVEMGRLVSAPDYLKAEQLRALLMEDFRKAFENVDVIVGPTMPITAWKSDQLEVQVGDHEESVLTASWRFTFPYNLTGLPAISIPCGFDRKGLPIGLQIAARPFDEPTLLRVASAYERSHAWKDVAPIF
jgi:aspartyl-tRNA(Asn)/glutamyl-tRNA(Gln) amidotransferase subunit A